MTDTTHQPHAASDSGTASPPVTRDTPVADLSWAPLPTERTLRLRRNLPYQATRFAAFNLRILRMVIKGHH